MENRWGYKETVANFIFFLAPKSLQMVIAAIKLKDACSLQKKKKKTMTNLLRSRDIILPTKVCLVKAMVFPAHVWM